MRGLIQSCRGVVQRGKPVLRTLPASASGGRRSFCLPLCSMAGSKLNPNIIKVVVNEAVSELGKAAVVVTHKARGMELAGAVDSYFQGQDAGEEYPSQPATQLASSLSGLGQIYNEGSDSNNFPPGGVVVGDGVHIHSMALPGLVSSLDVRFASPGETLSIRHDVTGLKALMPGLILAIRRVVHLKSLVYGLKKKFVGPEGSSNHT